MCSHERKNLQRESIVLCRILCISRNINFPSSDGCCVGLMGSKDEKNGRTRVKDESFRN